MRTTRWGRADKRTGAAARPTTVLAAIGARGLTAAAVAALVTSAVASIRPGPATAGAIRRSRHGTVGVVVRATPGHASRARSAVNAAQGEIVRPLTVVDGVAARVATDALASLRATPWDHGHA